VGLSWFSHNRKTRTSSSAYLGDDKPKNLTVWTDSAVVKILLEGAKATGVQLSNGSVGEYIHWELRPLPLLSGRGYD
jgi:choline dehydrogenase-like flavoprotein